jgi:hypothetical protein
MTSRKLLTRAALAATLIASFAAHSAQALTLPSKPSIGAATQRVTFWVEHEKKPKHAHKAFKKHRVAYAPPHAHKHWAKKKQ